MGWAKYAEDNYEIATERLYMRGGSSKYVSLEPSHITTRPVMKSVETNKYTPCGSLKNNLIVHVEIVSLNRRSGGRKYRCEQCGNCFVLTDRAQYYYRIKGVSTPGTCLQCKIKNYGLLVSGY